jgi:phage antirepressor YoqD-like protein
VESGFVYQKKILSTLLNPTTFTIMNNEIIRKLFAYDGSSITFAKKGETIMVNATQMAKPFGDSKRAKNWLGLKSTDEFLTVLSEGRNLPSSELVKVTYGNNGATWMQEDVALEFARWLSPAFAIWCNDRIKELMKYGITATEATIEKVMNDPDSWIKLLQALKEERQQRQLAESKVSLLEEVTKEQAPKVAFADAVLSPPDSILVGELAKILCQRGYQTGEIRLYEQLRHEGYLCSSGSDYNMPMQRYLEMGLFEVTKGTRSGNGGVMHTTRTTKVTPKGQQYFINKFIHS